MVVDDDQDLAEMLSIVLTGAGMEVDLVNRGDQVMDLFNSQEFKYNSCAGVNTSSEDPILSSFNLATSLSIETGTSCNPAGNPVPAFNNHSAVSA